MTDIAAFAVTAALLARRDLAQWQGVAAGWPWLAVALLVALLGLVGIPPTAVFVGRVTTVNAAWDGGYAWLAVTVFVNISLFLPSLDRSDLPQSGAGIVGRRSLRRRHRRTAVTPPRSTRTRRGGGRRGP